MAFNSYFAQGVIDELRIYSAALTQAQIKTAMTQCIDGSNLATITIPNLVACWKMDEDAGAITTDLVTKQTGTFEGSPGARRNVSFVLKGQ